MHLINLKNYSKNKIERIINTSIKIKNNPQKYKKALEGKKLYMLFEKTSTRTYLAFSMGITELGGYYFSQRYEESNFCVGEIQDEIRYVAKNADIVLARMKKHKNIRLMAEYSTVPIINGCCNKYHPTQALADLLTIKEIFGSYNIKLLYIGIWNNVLNSLSLSLPKLGGQLISITPITNEESVDADIVELYKHNDSIQNINTVSSEEELIDLIRNVDIVYVDTWVDMEFFTDISFRDEKERRIKIMSPLRLTKKLLDGSKAIVMHDMPMHPGYEIEREVIEHYLDYILQQAENRRHVAKGIYLELLKAN